MKSNLEKPIEDVIFNNKDVIHDFGFMVFNTHTFRQFKLPSEKKIDIVTWDTWDDECKLAIIEIKKDEITSRNGIMQAYEYAAELTDVLFAGGQIKTIHLSIVLVGYDLKDLSVLKFFSFQPDIYTYKSDPLRGFKFTQQMEGGTILTKYQAIDNVLNSILNT